MQSTRVEKIGENIRLNDNVLIDDCNDEASGSWFAPEGATDENAELILNLGCIQHANVIQMKNLGMNQGGTEKFTIFMSEYLYGPWNVVLTGNLKQTLKSGCSNIEMQSFKMYGR